MNVRLAMTGLMVVLDGQEHFSMWHIFLIVCAIPTVLAIIGLLSLPESPRILLAIGHEREALVIYQVTFLPQLSIKISSINKPTLTIAISKCCVKQNKKKQQNTKETCI